MRSRTFLSLAICWLTSTVAHAQISNTPRRVDIRAILTDPSNEFHPDTTFAFPNYNPYAFSVATERWSIFQTPIYSAAATPATEEDVATLIRLARENNFRFLATGGRHGYNGHLMEMRDGLALDLSALNTVEVDRESRTLTVGPGVVFDDIFGPLYEAGLQLQTGVCGCPSVIGVTIGSGVGRFQGIYGLVADALLSVRMITAEGEMIEVSNEVNQELFWGIRGAGANLGVIVSATYQAHPLYRGGQMTVLDFMFEADVNETYFDILGDYLGPGSNLPADLSVSTVLFYNQTHYKPQIMANWVYAGPEDEARDALADIINIPSTSTRIVEVPWNRLTATAVFGLDPLICTPGRPITVLGVNLRNVYSTILQDTFARMSEFWTVYPDASMSTISIESFPIQATMEYDDDSSAYPWRDTKTYMLLQPVFLGRSTPQAFRYMKQMRDALGAVSGYEGDEGLRTYVNYSQGDETLEQIYGAHKLPRLAALKARYDPNNVFRYNNPLPTSYP